MSMVVICYASNVTGFDRRRSELSNAALHMTQDVTSIEQYTFRSYLLDMTYILLLILTCTTFISSPPCNFFFRHPYSTFLCAGLRPSTTWGRERILSAKLNCISSVSINSPTDTCYLCFCGCVLFGLIDTFYVEKIEGRYVDIRILVMGDDSDVMGYHRRRSELAV